MRILIIERERQTTEFLEFALSRDGFHVQTCTGNDEAVAFLRTYEYEAVVLGKAGMPSGMAVRMLRSKGVATPILALSDDSVSSRIAALVEGADDCLSIPFHKAELSARLRAIIRRARALPHSVVKIGNLEIDLENHDVRVGGQALHLTATEYRMLELLALHKGRTVPKDKIFDALYDGIDDPEERVINVFVCKIRKKIAALNAGESYIATSWGGGYQLCEPSLARAA